MGVLDGLTVLDLSWGVSGPATAMLLADNGADVTRIERRVPTRSRAGSTARSTTAASAPRCSTSPTPTTSRGSQARGDGRRRHRVVHAGRHEKLGIDFDTLAASNPRLVYCSITGYGASSRFAERPGIDQLVAARLGYQWETRRGRAVPPITSRASTSSVRAPFSEGASTG